MNKKRISLIVFIIGSVTLLSGVVFLLLDVFKQPTIRDAEYLVQIGSWQEQDSSSVIWNFTEIGKGTLTTNGGTDIYDFIWSIENNTLKIETSWLYDLENEYSFSLDQKENKLTLTENDKNIIFIPSSAEPTQEQLEAEQNTPTEE